MGRPRSGARDRSGLDHDDSDTDGRGIYLVGLENVRFKQPVTPGDQLILKANLTKHRRGLWRFECVAEVDGKIAAEAEILMVNRKEP